MMTTMAALLGACAAGDRTGTGSELRRPLGITIIGGLIFSQVLTLYTTPVIYLWFDAGRPVRIQHATELADVAETRWMTRRRHESLPPVHPQTRCDHLADGRDDAVRSARLLLLPVSPLPQVEFPSIQVSATLPGASPETMADGVATPLERQFGRIAGVTEMTSTSTLGILDHAAVRSDRDIDAAAARRQAAINAARGQLPSNLPNNPPYRKANPADSPIMILAITSDTYTAQMYDVATTILQQKMAQVQGVGQVT